MSSVGYSFILYFTFLFSIFVFVGAAGQYNVIWTGTGLSRFRFGSGTVPALLFQIKGIIQQIVHVTSGHMAVYGPVCHQNKYYIDLRSFGPYNIFWVTDRSIYCHMTLSAMSYLLFNNSTFEGLNIIDWFSINLLTGMQKHTKQ